MPKRDLSDLILELERDPGEEAFIIVAFEHSDKIVKRGEPHALDNLEKYFDLGGLPIGICSVVGREVDVRMFPEHVGNGWTEDLFRRRAQFHKEFLRDGTIRGDLLY